MNCLSFVFGHEPIDGFEFINQDLKLRIVEFEIGKFNFD